MQSSGLVTRELLFLSLRGASHEQNWAKQCRCRFSRIVCVISLLTVCESRGNKFHYPSHELNSGSPHAPTFQINSRQQFKRDIQVGCKNLFHDLPTGGKIHGSLTGAAQIWSLLPIASCIKTVHQLINQSNCEICCRISERICQFKVRSEQCL